jgi:2-(1,2-epoxy-1,2-dihydrophenyl)acetyl-CoA isomerase
VVSVRYTSDGDLVEITLDRPDVLNSLDAATAGELRDALDRAEGAGARAILVRGEGRAFSAGRDLRGADPLTEDARAILTGTFNPLIQRVADVAVPTFAAVQGACLGVGLGIAMACDVVVAADDARVGSPFARIGAVLDSGAHLAFFERIGPHRALELVYTGRLLTGAEAARWGLVNIAVPAGELLEHVRAMAKEVAAGPTAAFRQSKAIVRRLAGERLDLAAVLAAEADAQGAVAGGADYVAGISAFLEKRAPTFRGE